MKKACLRWRLTLSICLLLIVTTACAGQESGLPLVWIDVPIQDLTFPLGSTINIEGHAADEEGISYVEIHINGDLVWTIDEFTRSGGLERFDQTWTPEEEGDYIIHAVAYRRSGKFSNPASVTVHIGSEEVAQVEDQASEDETPPSEEPTATPEPSSQETSVQFWADPPEIAAGKCSILHWHVENAQKVLLGKTEVSPDGDYEACHCNSTSYSLTVIHQDGTEETSSVGISVTGVCATPTPTKKVDKNPPPAPVLLKPLNASDLGCIGDTILRWQAVSDESGISEYQLQAQYHGGDSVWLGVPGSTWNGLTDTNFPINLECARVYRWRVRAIDGAGNPGPWSGWFTFEVPMI